MYKYLAILMGILLVGLSFSAALTSAQLTNLRENLGPIVPTEDSDNMLFWIPFIAICLIGLGGCSNPPPPPAVCGAGTHQCVQTASGCSAQDCVGGQWSEFTNSPLICSYVGL